MSDSIVDRLRDYDNCSDNDIDEAADMLEFFFNLMQTYSLDMGGQHSYRFRGGWPMNKVKGPNPEEAIRAGIKAVKEDAERN